MIDTPLRLSPLHDAVAHLDPTWGELGGMPIPLRVQKTAGECAEAERLGLCDVSALARLTVKGPAVGEILHGIDVPAAPLGVAALPQGGIIMRTGAAEFFVEDGPRGGIVAELKARCARSPTGVYEVPRQDAAILLSGVQAAEVLLQTCGHDFRTPPAQLVMTRIAGVSCMVLARQYNGIPAYQLWLDGTYGEYLWETLLAIARETGGEAVGWCVFFPDLDGLS